MTGKLMFVPDVDTLANIIRSIDGNHSLSAGALAEAIIAAIDTPPVLRWEGDYLMLGSEKIAASTDDHQGFYWVTLMQNDIGGTCESIEEGRREAEKALGLPIVEEL